MPHISRLLAVLLLFMALPTSLLADQKRNTFTLVIDAGHGGNDPGAIGTTAKEKDINLKVALAFGRLVENNCPDVKVVYTRKTDVFIPLQTRADIANRHKADLFVSIHTNALPKGKTAYGAETYTLGMARADANLEVAKRENSVITYEANYKETYEGFDPNKVESYIIFELMQDKYMQQSVDMARLLQQQYTRHAGRSNKGVHQAGFLVLRKTSMPAILTELGFISTPEEERYLTSEQGVRQLSQSLYNSFIKYRNLHDKVPAGLPQTIPDQPAEETKPNPTEKQDPNAHPNTQESEPSRTTDTDPPHLPVYKVQLMASDKPIKPTDKRLKGLNHTECYQENGMYKYTYGSSTSYNEIRKTQKTIADKFSGTFIVAFLDGQRIDLQEALKISGKK